MQLSFSICKVSSSIHSSALVAHRQLARDSLLDELEFLLEFYIQKLFVEFSASTSPKKLVNYVPSVSTFSTSVSMP